MKFLMLTSRFGSGYGMGYSAYKEATAMADHGHRITVVHGNRDIEEYCDPRITFVHVPISATPLIGLLLLSLRLKKVFRDRIDFAAFDAVYIQSLEFGLIDLSRIRIPMIYFARSTMVGIHNILNKEGAHRSLLSKMVYLLLVALERRCLQYSKIVVVKSRTMVSELTGLYGINAEKIIVVNGGIDEKDFPAKDASSGATFKRAVGISENIPVILYAGRIVPQKGLVYLVKAALNLLREYNFVVVIAGADSNAPYAASVKRLVMQSAHRSNFHFLGHVDQLKMSAVFHSADCVVTPSLYEPFGMVNLQAAVLGKTVITTSVTGSVDVLAEYTNKHIIAPGSVTAIECALKKVFSVKMCTLQTTVDFSRYSWEHVAEQLLRALSVFVGSGRHLRGEGSRNT